MDSFLVDLLQLQLQRHEATGFLTDGRIIQFFRVTRKSDSYLLEETPVYYLHQGGGTLLLRLLCTPLNLLGLPETRLECKGQKIAVGDILGIGGTATVYRGTFQSKEVVVKVFCTAKELGHLEREMAVLKKAEKSLLPDVPKIVGVSDSETTLLLSPVGTHFAHSSRYHKASFPLATRFLPFKEAQVLFDLTFLFLLFFFLNSVHFSNLIRVLEKAHKHAKLVHRDVKLSNFFQRENDGSV
jgi:hypothetical protein